MGTEEKGSGGLTEPGEDLWSLHEFGPSSLGLLSVWERGEVVDGCWGEGCKVS